MVFQFDSASLSPGRQVRPYLAFLLTENQQACCLNVPFGQKKKKKKITLLGLWNLVALFLATVLLCHVVLHFSGIHSSGAL